MVRAHIDDAVVTATRDLFLTASTTSRIRNLTAGGAGAGDFALGGSVSNNEIHNTIEAYITNVGDGKLVSARDIHLTAFDQSAMVSLVGGIGGSSSAAVGAAVGVGGDRLERAQRLEGNGAAAGARGVVCKQGVDDSG